MHTKFAIKFTVAFVVATIWVTAYTWLFTEVMLPDTKASVVHIPPPTRRTARIAIMVMLPESLLFTWAETIGAMAVNEDVCAFFFMWQAPITDSNFSAAVVASRGALVRAWHVPNTTWTTGRNLLAQAAYAAEVARGVRFLYWVFADEEVQQCANCLKGASADTATATTAACCLDFIVQDALLSPYGYAQYSTRPHQQGLPFLEAHKRSFLEETCCDAKFAAIHRDAAPILLPYASQYDAESWWWSQGVLQYV